MELEGFATAMDVDGDTLVVGAQFGYDVLREPGAAYVFTRTAGVWSQQQRLVAPVRDFFAHYGARVAVDGDTIAISNSSPFGVDVWARPGHMRAPSCYPRAKASAGSRSTATRC